MYSLRKFIMTDWSIEQKWMAILLPLLFLYNSMTTFVFLYKIRKGEGVLLLFLLFVIIVCTIYYINKPMEVWQL